MKVMNVTDEPPYSNDMNFERVAYSSEIYPIEYIPNFHELEYAIPVENGKEALRQIRRPKSAGAYRSRTRRCSRTQTSRLSWRIA
jgi:hypothetical protein